MERSSPRIRLVAAEAAAGAIRTRMPFRYGNACLTASPVLVVRVIAESPSGARASGFASDCLPPRWFDKDPAKDYRRNVLDQLAAYECARAAYLAAGKNAQTVFEHWKAASPATRLACAERGINALTASFGSSFFERALIDALCRLAGVSFFTALRRDLLGRATAPHVPERPLARIACRHTVGLADPIATADIPAGERLSDGLPQSLEECIERYGLRYFKVKVNGRRDEDLDRLGRLAELFARSSPKGYSLSLDGNEQYRSAEELEALFEGLAALPRGRDFIDRILYIEQPLSRDIALRPEARDEVQRLDRLKPVIIDESDDRLESFPSALELGYRGVSHKNSKGIFKTIENLALIGRRNREAGEERCFLTGEDLATTAVLPLQQDLASLAAFGVAHAERNGHHYFRGLDHLPAAEARSALARHPDLYHESGGSIFLRVEDGAIACGSLDCPGYGCAGEIAFEERTPLESWSFDEEFAGDV